MNAERLSTRLEEPKPQQGHGDAGPKPLWMRLMIGLIITILLATAFGSVIYLSLTWGDSAIRAPWQILSLTALAGVFGGSGRSMFAMIAEAGVRNKRSKATALTDLSNWPLYLMSPFMGGTSGVLFFLAINYGLVRPLIGGFDSQQFTFLPVFLISAAGGVFYEEVFSILNGLVGIFSTGQDRS